MINKRIPRALGADWMTSAELDTLEAFLETLTDWDFLTNSDLSNPFLTTTVAKPARDAR